MFGLRVPVISVVIGEGGSGGALAIGCANKNLIMVNAVYYVASREACAAILWKSRAASSQVCTGWCCIAALCGVCSHSSSAVRLSGTAVVRPPVWERHTFRAK